MAKSTFDYKYYFEDFKKDTKLDPEKQVSEYLAYCQLRNLIRLNDNAVGGINALYNNLKPNS